MDDGWVEEYAGYIREALYGGKPVPVADIVEDIDFRQRIGSDRVSLNRGLARLMERGEIIQLPDFEFALAATPPTDRSFTPVPDEVMDRVEADRKAFFAPFLNDPDPTSAQPTDPAWPKLRVTSAFWSEPEPGGLSLDPDSVGRAMRLFDTLQAELVAAGIPAQAGPFVMDEGIKLDSFTRIIHGPRDADPVRMFEIVRPAFERDAFGGSRLAVIEDENT